MAHQQTLILVKPDGVSKGLVGEILRCLAKHDLKVLESTSTTLEDGWVKNLYRDMVSEEYFLEIIKWLTSGPVRLLRVEGEGAVYKVKYQIVGKYPNGLRGKFAEDKIRNVAHAPNSIKEARRELELAQPIFERSEVVMDNRFADKVVFALTGMSECGKSTVGKYLDSRGIPRLKIVKIFERVRDIMEPELDQETFVKKSEEKDPHILWDAFIDELLSEMNRRGARMASIESLYGGGLGPYLKQRLGNHFFIVYVEAPLKKRIELQMIRQSLSGEEEAKRLLLPRDKIKEDSGIPLLKEMADEIIDNSGTLDDLYKATENLIVRYSG